MRRPVLFLLLWLTILPGCYAFNPYSTDALDELEKEFVKEINQSERVLRNPLLEQYINQLGKRLSQAANMPDPHFFIVNSPEVNAFAGPGGHVGVNTGLILTSATESELAAVMAHELAHVRLHHLFRLMEHQSQMHIPMIASMLASIALGAINPTLASGAMLAALGGVAQDSINFTRSKEKEADRIGIDMLIRAGFDPKAMANFFRKLQQNSRLYYGSNTVPAILRTHPLDDERIAEADNRSLHLPTKAQALPLEYQLFKELTRVSASSSADEQALQQYYQKGCRQEIACQYGRALHQISHNQFAEAQQIFTSLAEQDDSNLFFQIALVEADLGKKDFPKALSRLKALEAAHPENYAILRAYAHAFMAAGNYEAASQVLLRGHRRFKKDLSICEELAKAEAFSGRKAYAYFTKSQCELLQGRNKEAIRLLKIVLEMTKKDAYLRARAEAMIEEVKYLSST